MSIPNKVKSQSSKCQTGFLSVFSRNISIIIFPRTFVPYWVQTLSSVYINGFIRNDKTYPKPFREWLIKTIVHFITVPATTIQD